MKKHLATLSAVSCFCLSGDAFSQLVEVDPAGELSSSMEQLSSIPAPPQLATAPGEGDAAYFFDSLHPHGIWMDVSPFGPVWRPHVSVKDPAWRPYCHGGKWTRQNNAWHWNSEYEWGWAPFHYGRWIYGTGLGWIWIPGRQWSAAWVSWRNTTTHYGWAPMPPDKSVYIGLGGTSNDRFGWDFHFSLTDDCYSYMPCDTTSETVYIYDYGYNGYSGYFGYNYWPYYYHHHYGDYDRKHHHDYKYDRPVYDKPHNPAPSRSTSEPSRRTTFMQQITARSTPSSSVSSRPQVQQTQPVQTSQPSRRTSIMQQIVTRPAPSSSSAGRSIQQSVSQPRTSSSTGSSVSRGSSSSGGRSGRIADIMSRSQRK